LLNTRFRRGSYVLWIDRHGTTVYWRGDFDDCYMPRETPTLKLAAVFISAAHAYCCARPHKRLYDFHTRCISAIARSAAPEWDAHFSDRLVARILKPGFVLEGSE